MFRLKDQDVNVLSLGQAFQGAPVSLPRYLLEYLCSLNTTDKHDLHSVQCLKSRALSGLWRTLRATAPVAAYKASCVRGRVAIEKKQAGEAVRAT